MVFETSLCSNAVRPVSVETEANAAPPPMTIALFVPKDEPVKAGNVHRGDHDEHVEIYFATAPF